MLKKNSFTGFTPETIRFFRRIKKNNNKPWFEENRPVYEEHVLKPLRNLVEDLGQFMKMLDAQFDVRPQINRTIAKIYRDTRFSRDKTLFRDHLWIVFRRHQTSLAGELCFYFEIRIDSFSYGMGFYAAPREVMIDFKNRILANPQKFLRIVQNPVLTETFSLDGEFYTRSPVKEYPPELENWMKFKSFYWGHKESNKPLAFSNKLIEVLKEGFLILYPLYCYVQKMQPNVKVAYKS
ncbi:MAG TPA: DUF2461 domain-containing protein [Bacteroidetes bacterium]|nr:DUF2461 domain-containing protein [Bacteroidota bacterium]